MQLSEITQAIVLLKVDFNIPSLEDVERIQAALPTINQLLDQHNRIVLLTHWGRPIPENHAELTTQHLIPIIEKLVGKKVSFVDQYKDFVEAERIIEKTQERIYILENTRFDNDEQAKDAATRLALAEKYAILGQFFVNEAFSLSHRKEATNYELSQLLPQALGIQYNQEIKALDNLKTNTEHPFVGIMGGAKLETKLPLIASLLPKVDTLIISGLLGFTFLQAAADLKIIDSSLLYETAIEQDFLQSAKDLLTKYPEKIVLSKDLLYETIDGKIYARDMGEKTLNEYQKVLQNAKTIFWNGPLGKYEQSPFDSGTRHLGHILAALSDCYIVIGGGDTVAAVDKNDLKNIDFISTGGGATLEYLAS